MNAQYLVCLLLAFCGGKIWALRCWECENVFSQQECLNRGRLVECDPLTQDTCQITLRHGGWGDYPLIEKSCKQLAACGNNHIQDSHDSSVFIVDNTQCNMRPPSSVCRCCCNTDGCNQNITFCNGPLGGLPCNALRTPRNGVMTCLGGNMPQSECRFRCKRGYQMVGSPVSRCNLFSQRDYEAPTCERKVITCSPLRDQENGAYRCTRNFRHKSQCRFTCNSGYNLIGASLIECYQDRRNVFSGTWSRPQPICQLPQCRPQTLENGQIACTNERFVGSTCSFRCNEEYRLVPSTVESNTCRPNEEWSRRIPCCALPCPPNAIMDFVVVLDSSSSVGAENFNRMKQFVRTFLSDFRVNDNFTHFAVFRYNNMVDMQTQILFNDFPNSLDGVLRAFDAIPYDGRGTRTGNALNYTAQTILAAGNRPNARDVVLLITDGASQDDVVVPSQILHSTGALILVLPVNPPTGMLDLSEIDTIARNPDNVIRDALEGGFEALDENFARRISGRLCDIPCL